MLRLHNKLRRDINKGLSMLGMATDDVAMTWDPQPETPMTLKLQQGFAIQHAARQTGPACMQGGPGTRVTGVVVASASPGSAEAFRLRPLPGSEGALGPVLSLTLAALACSHSTPYHL